MSGIGVHGVVIGATVDWIYGHVVYSEAEMNDDELDRMERETYEQIRYLQELHQKAMKPFIDQLTRIRYLRTPVFVQGFGVDADGKTITG